MEMLAKLGFGVLMLIAGLEIDLGMLLARGQKAKQASPLMLAVMMSLMTVVMAAFGAWLLLDSSTPLLHLAIYAVILSTTSVGIVVPTIPERRSAEHTSELQSLMRISSAVFCLKKKKQ